MPWFKVDDSLYSHPKWLATPPGARALWVSAGSWCASHLQDGHVPRHVLPILGGRPRDAAELVRAGLWVTTDGGWLFHDWLEMQPSAEQVEGERAAARERQRRARERAKSQPRHAVTDGEVPPVVTVPPTRPDPTRPSDVDPSAAANGTQPAERQRRIDEACRSLADERAATRDVGPGWAPAAARGLATDHHQALHAHLLTHPDATTAELIELIDTPKRPDPPTPTASLRPAHEILAELPPRDDDLNAAGPAQARAALRGA